MSTALPGYFKLNGLLKINGDVPLVVNGDVVLLFCGFWWRYYPRMLPRIIMPFWILACRCCGAFWNRSWGFVGNVGKP